MGRFCISPPAAGASPPPHGWGTITFSALTIADSGCTIVWPQLYNKLVKILSVARSAILEKVCSAKHSETKRHFICFALCFDLNHYWPWWPVSEHWNASSCHFIKYVTFRNIHRSYKTEKNMQVHNMQQYMKLWTEVKVYVVLQIGQKFPEPDNRTQCVWMIWYRTTHCVRYHATLQHSGFLKKWYRN